MAKRAYLFLPFLFCACKRDAPALFESLPVSRTGIDFANTLAEGDSLNILNYVYYYNGGGVGIADFNNDGREDIFFAGNETSSRLYYNRGDLQFEDVTQQAGVQTSQWCTGVAIADVNEDGWMDIYVCAAGYAVPERRKNLLFINQGKSGKPGFTESAAAYGLADTAYSTQAAFFDYDGDGDLDLYVMNHANERETLNTPLPKKVKGEGASSDHLYRNNGDQTFTDVSAATGILTEGYGLGIAVSDVNQDGWPDIYISNDFIYNDVLYINEGGRHFSNQISRYIKHQTYNGMGCDFADYNNDARPDLVVMDMLPETDANQKKMAGAMTWDKWQIIQQAGYEPQYVRNTLQLAVGSTPQLALSAGPDEAHRTNTLFSEIAQLAGIAATDWSWAPLFGDFDNDGWKDLFISNGYLRDITDKDFIHYSNNLTMFRSPGEADRELLPAIRKLQGKRLPNRIFQNNRDLTFAPKPVEWGITQPSCSNGAAYADLDADGDLDLVVSNINEAAFVYENKSDKLLKNKYLNIKLEGLSGNRSGIGARVFTVIAGQRQYVEQYLSRGFMSSVTDVLHLGLGVGVDVIDTLQVYWSDGRWQQLTAVRSNQTITLQQAQAQPFYPAPSPVAQPWLEDVTRQYGLDFRHKSRVFNDFQFQPLLPHGFSENGPPIATGDLNGDGLEDVYVGGGRDQAGQLFFQQPGGRFLPKDLPEVREGEYTDALIFDANGDHINDLYIVSGSNEWAADDPAYQDRLYLNDGKGNLRWANEALPAMYSPGACAATADFDADGDMDVFVGGSAMPGNYPLPARSYLLRNDGGHFSDVTETVAPSLMHPGLVTAAKWADIDHDGTPDLVLVGEWMPVSVYKNDRGTLRDVTADMGLAKTTGWWNSLAIHDLDGDGDLDLVAGNLGMNSRYKASQEHPLKIYAKDFDHNGRLDAVICRYVDGREKPVHQRDELLAQINGLGKNYVRYATYATATMQDVFGEKTLPDAYLRGCQYLQTGFFIQEDGLFSFNALPVLAQTAPVNAVLCADFNADNHTDILLAGNAASASISTGQYDAFNGLMLLGDGAGRFRPEDAQASGFFVTGVGKKLAPLFLQSGENLVLCGVHNGQLRVFRRTIPQGFIDKNSKNFIHK